MVLIKGGHLKPLILTAPLRQCPFARFPEKAEDRFFQPVTIGQFALPDDQCFPVEPPKRCDARCIALNISEEFRPPIFDSRSRQPSFPATGVLVPKAAVHKYCFFGWPKRQIWPAWQIFAVQPVTVPN